MSLSIDEKIELLRSISLLADVSDGSIRALAERTGEIDFEPGDYLLVQGQIGNGLFLIVSGAVDVMRGDEALARLGPRQVVGEISVIDQLPRVAGAVAVEATHCLALASWDFIELLERDGRLALAVMKVLAGRLRDADQRIH